MSLITKRPYPLNEVPEYSDFKSMLNGIAGFADRPALTWYDRKGESFTRSYSELSAYAESFSLALAAAGLGEQNIAVAGENSYEWLIAFLGITAAGAVAVLIDIDQSAESINDMIARADAKAIVCSRTIEELLSKENAALTLIGMSAANMDKFIAENSSENIQHPTRPDAAAVIAFTSGTTSFAKPVVLSQSGLLKNAAESVGMVTPTERVFSSLPFYHTYGLTCSILGNLIYGTHLGINGDIKTTFRDLKLFDPQTLMAVPLIVESVYKLLNTAAEKAGIKRSSRSKVLREVKNSLFGSLSSIVCGGAHIAKSIILELNKYGILLLQGYGITECSPLISSNRYFSHKPDSAGHVLPSYEIKFDCGEILVKGPSVMLGYYREDELTARAFDQGWFRTGDMGHLDISGHLHITGRKKNLIVLKNGKKIAPEEIELLFSPITLVSEVMAYGATSGASADDVKLAVMIFPDKETAKGMSSFEICTALQQEVDALNKRLPAYKQIQLVNVCENEMKKTSSKKIKRKPI